MDVLKRHCCGIPNFVEVHSKVCSYQDTVGITVKHEYSEMIIIKGTEKDVTCIKLTCKNKNGFFDKGIVTSGYIDAGQFILHKD